MGKFLYNQFSSPDFSLNFIEMKLLISTVFCAMALSVFGQIETKKKDTLYLQPIEVIAIRAGDKSPFTKSNLTKKQIENNNLGQDLPYLLNQIPSVVINSDAGNGVGYTGIRIRGTDATRINVTLNGIPYNDAESQGTFFVDLPDFSSSVNSIQVQRGVGTSSNGAGAFGASINLSTNEINDSSYFELNNSYGSYNTLKNTLKFGSGIIGKNFIIDGRLSRISSDGYVDRASSNLKSFYLSTAFVDEKQSLRLNIFSGKEKTYQSWYGIPESLLETNRTYNSAGQEQPSKPYDNETDNYTQTHYQLFYNNQLNNYWKSNIAIFLTKGAGYYEQYKSAEAFTTYGLPDYQDGNSTITQTDLIRQLWLDNNFYGSIFSIQHQKHNTHLTIGGSLNQYDGVNFGDITWAKVQAAVPSNYKWYNHTATKKDLSFYTKWTQQINQHWQSFIDLQFRNVNYTIKGFRDNPGLFINNKYHFLNPKVGMTYNFKNWQAFLSYAMASKEPNRDDFEAGTALLPKAEKLQDIELGIERKNRVLSYSANFYFMQYKDQLVLTGKINDVGAYTRSNIAASYRAGVELQTNLIITKKLNVAANLTMSENRINNFTEYIDDYDNGGQVTNFYKKSILAFSPSVIAGSSINITPFKNGEINLINKYVGRQYLDNTENFSRSLHSYFTQDIRLSYLIQRKFLKEVRFIVQLNNVFNKRYEANGYTFSYVYGGMTTENYYFPMAPFNGMMGINIRL
jgi:iron complex outermembrane receptor protein